MNIDIHVHPAFYEAINKDADKEEYRHSVLDVHKNGIASLQHIFNQMKCANLDKLVLLPEDYTSCEGDVVVSNYEIKSIVDLAPEKFIGFASIDPFREDALEELEKAFKEYNLKGLKLHLGRLKIYPMNERLKSIYELCIRYNKPIIFHSGFSWEPNSISKYTHPLEFEEVAINYPRLRICLAHFGWPWVKETSMLMLKYPNVYADTGILYFDSAREFYNQVFTKDIPITWIERSLRHQIMFGSNNPRFEQIRMVEALKELGLSKNSLELIMGENAIRFIEGL
jgi:uncharacterized protein